MQAMAHSPVTILAAILSISSLFNLVSSARYSVELISGSFGCTVDQNASTIYQENVNILYSDFISQSALRGYYNTSVGNSSDMVFGYYMCRGDLKPDACQSCIINATQSGQRMGECKKYEEGFYFSGNCIMGYANHSMYGIYEPRFVTEYTPLGDKVSNYQQYNQTVASAMEAVIHEAAFESKNSSILGFATKEASITGDEKVYCLAQCTPDIVGANCSSCLRKGLSTVGPWKHKYQGAWYASANCVLRYDNRTFLGSGEQNKGHGLKAIDLVAIIYSAMFMLMYYTHLVLY